jgi:hypothetical protein
MPTEVITISSSNDKNDGGDDEPFSLLCSDGVINILDKDYTSKPRKGPV